MSPQGGRASWHTTQAAAFSILIRRVAAQYSREEATESTCTTTECVSLGKSKIKHEVGSYGYGRKCQMSAFWQVLTDKTVRAAGAQACAPLSCLDVGPIAACAWLVGDHWVRHYSLLLDLILDCEACENTVSGEYWNRATRCWRNDIDHSFHVPQLLFTFFFFFYMQDLFPCHVSLSLEKKSKR